MGKVDPREGVRSFPKMRQEDLTADVEVFTVAGYEQRKMPDGGLVKELLFEEVENLPLRLNKTQVEYLIAGLGCDDSDDWAGKQVPVEKIKVQGPDGKDHNVVWVCAPETWVLYFKEAGIPVPDYAAKLVKEVKAAKPATRKPARKPVKKRGR